MYDKDLFADYTVFDIETTGLGRYDEIVEIGALKLRNHQVTETFCSFVRPTIPIPASATVIHGITNSMVRDAPPIREVLEEFFAFAGSDVVIGHNIASFDLPFVRRYAGRSGDSFGRTYVDTISVAKRKLPQLGSYTLARLCESLGVNEKAKHRALGDCYSTYSCYEKMMRPDAEAMVHIPIRKAEKTSAFFGTKRSDKTSALQDLQVILLDITADRQITRSEVDVLQSWHHQHHELRGNYPYDKVFEHVEQALEDGILTAEEIDSLLHVFLSCSNSVGDAERETTICFDGKCVCVTGEFRYGGRSQVRTLMESCGANWKDGVTRKTDALIIGDCGSDAWACGCYGGKIKKAMELVASGCEIVIVQESRLPIFRARE